MSEKPELMCSECGARLGVGEWKGRIITKCPYCGCDKLFREDARIVTERIKSNRISSIEHRRLDIEERRAKAELSEDRFWDMFGRVILVALMVGFFGMLAFGLFSMLWKISPPEDSSYYKGKEVHSIERSFRDAGFLNVSVSSIPDGRYVGYVDHVTINGESEFYKDFVLFFHDRSEYGRLAPVVIYYHTEKPK